MPALILTAETLRSLAALRAQAAANPLNVHQVLQETSTEAGILAFRTRARDRTVVIHEVRGRFHLLVCFSIVIGNPVGPMRQMSVSLSIPDALPGRAVVEMIANQLGFVGGFDCSKVWLESVEEGHQAVNLAQPISCQDPEANAASMDRAYAS